MGDFAGKGTQRGKNLMRLRSSYTERGSLYTQLRGYHSSQEHLSPEGFCRRPEVSRAPETAAEAPGRTKGLQWGLLGYERQQRPETKAEETSPSTEYPGSRGWGPILPQRDEHPGVNPSCP